MLAVMGGDGASVAQCPLAEATTAFDGVITKAGAFGAKQEILAATVLLLASAIATLITVPADNELTSLMLGPDTGRPDGSDVSLGRSVATVYGDVPPEIVNTTTEFTAQTMRASGGVTTSTSGVGGTGNATVPAIRSNDAVITRPLASVIVSNVVLVPAHALPNATTLNDPPERGTMTV